MIKTTKTHAFFYTEWPSNFTKTHFTWSKFKECHEFFTTKQAFMWAKAKFFKDEESAEKILEEKHLPMVCRMLGREVKNYDDNLWSKVRYDYMLSVNIEKFSQDAKLRVKILDSKFDGLEFVEASPRDCICGVGLALDDPKIIDPANWRGQNLLGKVLTETRRAVVGLEK